MSTCPFLAHPPNPYPGLPEPKIQREFFNAVEKMNWNDVKSDIKKVLKDSKEWWPADYGHYGGFFIRMAWHATGTYRER
jgi:catalase (peroxidase I)